MRSPPSPRTPSWATPSLPAGWATICLIGLTLLAYLPTWHGGFIWDDNNFLTDNPLIHAADGLRRFWLTREAPDYWPLSSSSLWVEWRWWGLHAAGYHATNLLLHVGSVILLWRTLERLRVPGAYWGALIFALHPVNVESVAWITQRKNLLAMLFFLAAIRCFLQSARRDRWQWLSLGCFVLALLSKGSVIPLPLALLGILGGASCPPRAQTPTELGPKPGRTSGPVEVNPPHLSLTAWGRLAPFFALSALFAVINLQFQAHDYGAFRHVTLLERCLGAAAAFWFYLDKAFWPVRLSFVYPQWSIDARQIMWWLPLLAAVMVTVLLWRGRNRPMVRPIWFTWAYCAVMLAPALGFTDVGFMKFSLVSDHYQHLALIGPAALAGAAMAAAFRRTSPSARPTLLAAVGAALLVLGILTWRQNQVFADPERLYRTTLERTPDSSLAHNNLAILLSNQPAHQAEAAEHYRAALAADPTMAEAHFNLANLYAHQPGGAGAAEAQYEAALRLNPRLSAAHNNLGRLLVTMPGRQAEAIEHFETALRLSPQYFAAQLNLANALAQAPGRTDEAVRHYEAALRLNPDHAEAQNNLANLLSALPGRLAEAVPHYRAALRLRPDLGQIHANLAAALAQLPGNRAEAAAEYRRALQLDPSLERARTGLAELERQ